MLFRTREIREKIRKRIERSILTGMAGSREQMKRFRFAHEINLI